MYVTMVLLLLNMVGYHKISHRYLILNFGLISKACHKITLQGDVFQYKKINHLCNNYNSVTPNENNGTLAKRSLINNQHKQKTELPCVTFKKDPKKPISWI